ncbi:MAG: type 2 isopentenyl-diphosphate Delta-isomerase [Methanomicrobiaceae archaeon]|uniref:Isopentenyl-diphosphate delta-isomerase, fmn-dependent n=1 Tax=hydrocarbon metagenome TaxID=938273 RepID=A0A0W8FFP4_9ZZZZ|nr:type 2 isopentenyl-diphosphate Delta-isomerase [Methanomicrobiaceae archaeon]MDD5420105.1 type 2 isopentenyl-diphosphate Delta-isomerase [Methanomicrobiaceae archaeon]
MRKNITTSSRKQDHLIICSGQAVESGYAGFDDVRLVHNALPECDMDRIDTRTRFLGTSLGSPLFIAAMTGGHPDTLEVNRTLARAAERYGLGMGVGSQRAALEDPGLEESFTVVRDEAPHAFLCANLGIVQLREHGLEWAERAVEMIDAQAIAIHLNFLQEAIQPEGDHNAAGCLEALQHLCRDFRYPVIVKETGCGISAEIARVLWGAGASAIDLGGWGGTSWAAVERLRAADPRLASLGELFMEWGIPSVVSVCEVSGTGGPLIATGGLRNGIDIAKCIALGANLGGMALPLLKPSMEGEEALFETIELIHQQLRVAMFLTGSRTISDLKRTRTYITGITRQMIEQD